MERLRDFDSAQLEDEKRRLWGVMAVVLAVFGLLIVRLWFMQVIEGTDYRQMSENNRVRLRDISPCRGLIYDRNGTLLVDNRPGFALSLVREEAKDVPRVLRELSVVTGRPLAELEARLEAAEDKPPFQPVMLVPNADRDLVAQVEMHRFDLPGVIIEVKPKRSYPLPELAPHLLGYLGEAGDADLEKDDRLLVGDYVGKYGVEAASQPLLAGVHGRRRIEVDASGREMRSLGEIDPRYGRSLRLTIDCDLQQVAQQALEGKAGGIVAMDVDTGEILALASAPTFDPNSFVEGLKPDTWRELRDNPGHPLHNRVLQAAYPPGSTYKIILALAALEQGVIHPDTRMFCPGGYHFGNRTYRCWKKGGHGTVDLRRALVESCDTYFYQVGQALGIDRMAYYGQAFGLGRPVGLGLGREAPGTVPSQDWKRKRFKQPWHPGETISCAIGQGYNTATPLQMLEVIAAVANGGKLVRPQIIRAVEGEDGVVRQVLRPEIMGRLPVSDQNLAFMRDALAAVVQEGGGTATVARSKIVPIGGKTGTAQVVKMPGDTRGANLPEQYRDHAWFVAFAPTYAPRIALAVLIEHGGHGGSAAAPVAKAFMEEAARKGYFAAEGIPASPPPPPPGTTAAVPGQAQAPGQAPATGPAPTPGAPGQAPALTRPQPGAPARQPVRPPARQPAVLPPAAPQPAAGPDEEGD